MGLLSLIKGGSRNAKTVTIDSKLGNVLITGSSKKGPEEIIRSYAIEALNNDNVVVIFRDQSTGYSAYPSITTSLSYIYEIDCADNSTTNQVDIFAGYNESEINTNIIKLFDQYNEIDRTKKMSFTNYIAMLRTLTKKAGKNVRLDQLVDYPIEEIEDLNSRYSGSPIEQSRNDRFLSGIRSDISELESYFYDFSQNVLGYVFSGTKSFDKIFAQRPRVEISMDFSGKLEESKIIMTTIIDSLLRCNVSTIGKNGIKVIASEVPNEVLIESGLQKLIKNNRNFGVLYTVADISSLVEQSNEWIDFADTYFFFKQTSNKNKDFCSELFGEYEREKESVTMRDTKFFFYESKDKTRSLEKERVYAPEVFSGLQDNQAIYYNKTNNEHTFLTVY